MISITYDEWMRRTRVTLSRRSKELKAVDETLKEYGRTKKTQALLLVKQTFEIWKRSKGQGNEWQNSQRNRDKVIFELNNQLSNQTGIAENDLINARLGVLYLFGNTKVQNQHLNLLLGGSLSVVSSGYAIGGALGPSSTTTITKDIVNSYAPHEVIAREGQSATKPLIKTGYNVQRTHREESISFNNILDLLMDYTKRIARYIYDEMNKLYRDKMAVFNSDAAVKAAKNLVIVSAKQLFAQVKDQVGGASQLFQGLVNTLDASAKAVKSYQLHFGVKIRNGHPAAIIEALYKSLKNGIGYGLYDLLKGAATTGASFLGGVGSAIFSLVVSIMETIAKFIYRIKEVKKISAFLEQASEYWQAYRERAAVEGTLHSATSAQNLEANPNPAQIQGIHTDAKRFHQWFREHMIECPILAAIALYSGICGDKMRFLDMMTYDLSAEQSQDGKRRFVNDAAYLDYLKTYAGTVIAASPYMFYSAKDDVDAYINRSKNFIKESDLMSENNRISAFGFVKKFSTA